MSSKASEIEDGLEAMQRVGPDCVFRNIKILGRAIERIYDEAFAPIGLTASQVSLLWTVLILGSATLNEIARATHSDQTTVSRTGSRASDLGLVIISQHGSDKRQKFVELSPFGRARLSLALPLWKKAQASVATAMDATALKRMVRQIGRISPSYQESR